MSEAIELVGKRAPAFTLPDDTDQKQKLADYHDRWVVLYFYPKADTPGCTTQACEFTASIKDFEGLDTTVIGISPDNPAALAKFRAKHKLKVTLLGDTEKKVMPKYQAFGEKVLYGKTTIGVKRSTVIINPAGKIVHHWKAVKAKGHAAKVAEKLAALQA